MTINSDYYKTLLHPFSVFFAQMGICLCEIFAGSFKTKKTRKATRKIVEDKTDLFDVCFFAQIVDLSVCLCVKSGRILQEVDTASK